MPREKPNKKPPRFEAWGLGISSPRAFTRQWMRSHAAPNASATNHVNSFLHVGFAPAETLVDAPRRHAIHIAPIGIETPTTSTIGRHPDGSERRGLEHAAKQIRAPAGVFRCAAAHRASGLDRSRPALLALSR